MSTPRKTDADTPKPRRSAPLKRYVRNLTHVQVSFRIGDSSGRRIELKPRGMRGDIAAIDRTELDQLNDVDVLYEIITEPEMKEVTAKQVINQQTYHPALSMMKNSKGESYTKGVVIASEQEAQGIVVAHLEEEGKRGVGINRVLGPERVNRPGSIEEARSDAGLPKVTIAPAQKSQA